MWASVLPAITYSQFVRLNYNRCTPPPHKVIIRDTHLETGCPARQPAQVAGRWGHINWNSLWWVKKYFVLGWPEEPRQDKSLVYRHDEPNEPTKECPLLVPIHHCFNSQQGPPLSGLSGYYIVLTPWFAAWSHPPLGPAARSGCRSTSCKCTLLQLKNIK